jgi:hypothetical protein
MQRISTFSIVAAVVVAATVTSASAAHRAPARTTASSTELATQIARGRFALAPFATSLSRAKRAGWNMQITPMMPGMGFHYMNPKIKDFDVRKPPILVYVRRGGAAQLVAAEWVFPQRPAAPPLPGARYGSFAAACHYADGTFTPHTDEATCAPTSAGGAKFTFWHPDLVTMHVWMWYPNPAGVFNSTNPLIAPFGGAMHH